MHLRRACLAQQLYTCDSDFDNCVVTVRRGSLSLTISRSVRRSKLYLNGNESLRSTVGVGRLFLAAVWKPVGETGVGDRIPTDLEELAGIRTEIESPANRARLAPEQVKGFLHVRHVKW